MAKWSEKGQNETVKNGHFWSKNGRNVPFFSVFFDIFLAVFQYKIPHY